jgi:hypothetical protein
VRSDIGRDLPPDEAEWISSVAAAIRTALDDPSVQAEIVGLLCGDEERRQRRLKELAAELEGRELTMRLGDGGDDA